MRHLLLGDPAKIDAAYLERAKNYGVPVRPDSQVIFGQSGLTPYLSWITPFNFFGSEQIVVVINETVWVTDLKPPAIRTSKPRRYPITSVTAAKALPPYLKLKFADGEKLVVVSRYKRRAKDLLPI